MDFLDVAKVLFRRWYVAIPCLLLTIATAAWFAFTSKPDYSATAHVTMVAPSVIRNTDGVKTVTINPWTTALLADAAHIEISSQSLHDRLTANGKLPIEWTAELNVNALDMITINVVAPEKSQAVLITNQLVGVVESFVKQRQSNLRLQPGEEITTLRLEQAPMVEVVRTKVIRSAVAVLAAGLIVTAGLSLAVDGIIRRRSRRNLVSANKGSIFRSSGVPVGGGYSAPAIASSGTIYTPPAPRSDDTVFMAPIKLANGIASTPGRASWPNDKLNGARVAPVSPVPTELPPLSVEYKVEGSQSAVEPDPVAPMSPVPMADPVDLEDFDEEPSGDSTIVLPLSGSPSSWRNKNGDGRSAEAKRN
jgi:capsular polysaccharide biosynthesis protein